MRNFTFIFIFIFVLCSCSNEVANYEFENYQWNEGSSVVLKFKSENAEKKDLYLEIRSVYGIPYEMISLDFILEKPNGEKIQFSKDIKFKGENLDCAGDLCDQKVLIMKDLNLDKGDYSLKITHFNMNSNIYGLMEFRLIKE